MRSIVERRFTHHESVAAGVGQIAHGVGFARAHGDELVARWRRRSGRGPTDSGRRRGHGSARASDGPPRSGFADPPNQRRAELLRVSRSKRLTAGRGALWATCL